MAYIPVEIYEKKIKLFGITIWKSVKTISQEKFYEIVSARIGKEIQKEIDKEFSGLKDNVADEVMERVNIQLGEIVRMARKQPWKK